MQHAITDREECEADFDRIWHLVKEAFAGAEHTDGDEHNLVSRLRHTDNYIPELSLVAEHDGVIVGYAMFSRIHIDDVAAVALAPLAVLPAFQSQGIGPRLILAGHKRAMEMGYPCSVVLGSPEYYTRSGYLPAAKHGIRAPFDVPEQFYMVYPLNSPLPSGMVRYSPAFG